MKVGLVAEGPCDIAVLCQVLKGALGLERKDMLVIRPELSEDETDRGRYQAPRPERFSNWLHVMQECRDRTRIEEFLVNILDDDRFVIIQIDTAEAGQPGYEVHRPDRKDPAYVQALRAAVSKHLASLLGPALSERTRFAVAVEEIDAWLLTLYEPEVTDTGQFLDAKGRLALVLQKRLGKKLTADPRLYEILSKDLGKPKKLRDCATRNASLAAFLASLPPRPE